MIIRSTFDATIGRFHLYEHRQRLVGIALPASDLGAVEEDLEQRLKARVKDGTSPVLEDAANQLDEYLSGERTGFDLPVELVGTDFQRAVWNALQEVEYGTKASYADIAARIGKPGAARAVGQANRRNPLPIIVPCHRIVTASGALGGYMGDVAPADGLKARLLAIEQT